MRKKRDKNKYQYRKFTTAELDLIREKYPATGTKELVKLMSRSRFSIALMARKIGVKFGRYWTPNEIAELIRRFPLEGAGGALRVDIGKGRAALNCQATKLGLVYKKPYKNLFGRYSNSFMGFKDPENDLRYDVPGTVIAEIRNGLIRGKRRIDFDIDLEYLHDILRSQNGLCRFTGERISFTDDTASVDRIDSAKGYVRGNVQVTTNLSNLAKGKRSDEEMIAWCRKVVKHQNAMARKTKRKIIK